MMEFTYMSAIKYLLVLVLLLLLLGGLFLDLSATTLTYGDRRGFWDSKKSQADA
jgi:hypothetical protein